MMTYACDTCGATTTSVPPPTWVALTVVAQVPSPEPAAPTNQQYLYYVCDKHDPAGIEQAFHESLATLPAKATP